MLDGLIGKKIGMTSIYVDGLELPVTAVFTGECYVVQKKVKDRDGYEAVQLGYGEKSEKRVGKAQLGHFKKAGTSCFYHLKEFSGTDLDSLKLGQKIDIKDVLSVGETIDVVGTSKGRGFAGVIKRHNFSRGPMGHGSKHKREGGSIGQSASPAKVFKGMKMPGQMGNERVTIQNLEVVGIREKDNIILIKGAVPGPVNGTIVIKKSIKKRAAAAVKEA